MDNDDTTKRFVCVLNKKIPIGRAMNAIGQMIVGISSLYKDNIDDLRVQTYWDKNGGEHKSISDNPYIVLKAE